MSSETERKEAFDLIAFCYSLSCFTLCHEKIRFERCRILLECASWSKSRPTVYRQPGTWQQKHGATASESAATGCVTRAANTPCCYKSPRWGGVLMQHHHSKH